MVDAARTIASTGAASGVRCVQVVVGGAGVGWRSVSGWISGMDGLGEGAALGERWTHRWPLPLQFAGRWLAGWLTGGAGVTVPNGANHNRRPYGDFSFRARHCGPSPVQSPAACVQPALPSACWVLLGCVRPRALHAVVAIQFLCRSTWNMAFLIPVPPDHPSSPLQSSHWPLTPAACLPAHQHTTCTCHMTKNLIACPCKLRRYKDLEMCAPLRPTSPREEEAGDT